jgi:translation initiation factor 1
MSPDSRLVWSSKEGDLRKKSSGPEPVLKSPHEQTIYLHRDTKNRGGKVVTLVKGLALSESDLSALTKKLKQACGSGGSVKNGEIEIQGEHRQKIAEILRRMGYRVKIAGG